MKSPIQEMALEGATKPDLNHARYFYRPKAQLRRPEASRGHSVELGNGMTAMTSPPNTHVSSTILRTPHKYNLRFYFLYY